jgi:hypothetical protein
MISFLNKSIAASRRRLVHRSARDRAVQLTELMDSAVRQMARELTNEMVPTEGTRTLPPLEYESSALPVS